MYSLQRKIIESPSATLSQSSFNIKVNKTAWQTQSPLTQIITLAQTKAQLRALSSNSKKAHCVENQYINLLIF